MRKVDPEVKHFPARKPKKPVPKGWRPLKKGCERRTWALPDVSAGGKRHDRFGVGFGVVVWEGLVEPRIEDLHFPEHFGHRSGSASHTFLIDSRHFLKGMRRGSWAETSIASTASPSVCISFVRLLGPPATHLVGIPPAVVVHELKALVANVLGDRGDKVKG